MMLFFAFLGALVLGCNAVLPQQIRLALTSGPESETSINVVFATSNLTEPSYVPTVLYGIGQVSNTAGCVSYNYTHEPAYQKSVFTHVCLLENLTPDTLYVYQVGDSNDGYSALLNFTSPPLPGSPFSMVMYGDMGVSYSEPTANLVSNLVHQKQVDLVLHAGDISYADNRADINNGTIYEGILDDFYNEIQPYAAYVPYMMSPGNHEAIYDFIAYRMRVATSMPTNTSGSYSPYWYSFDYGNAHFISFSIEQPYNLTDPQGIWLLNDILQAAAPENRTIRPWIIAYAHRPMWCSNDFWCPDTSLFKANWETIFNQYVDIYIAGHVHVYERIWPVSPSGQVLAKNYENMNTTLHICTGSPGNIELALSGWYTPTPEWSAFRYTEIMTPQSLGVSHLQVYNSTHAFFEFIDANTTNIIDSFWISRPRF